jgi:hypothetical protein
VSARSARNAEARYTAGTWRNSVPMELCRGSFDFAGLRAFHESPLYSTKPQMLLVGFGV